MKGFKEVGIPLLIWIYFLSEGIRGAMEIPGMDIEPKDPMPITLKAVAMVLTCLIGFAVVIINSKRRKMGFEIWLEKKLTQDTYKKIAQRINFPILAASFFGLIGLGGLMKAVSMGAPQINRDILQVTASMGAGCFFGWLFSRKTDLHA